MRSTRAVEAVAELGSFARITIMEVLAHYEERSAIRRCSYRLFEDRIEVEYSELFLQSFKETVNLSSLDTAGSRGWNRSIEFVPALCSVVTMSAVSVYLWFKMETDHWAAILFACVAVCAVAWAGANARRQEWVQFAAKSGGESFVVRRTRRDRVEFDKFVDAVAKQITKAHAVSKPTAATNPA
jgi:hypothetical protein